MLRAIVDTVVVTLLRLGVLLLTPLLLFTARTRQGRLVGLIAVTVAIIAVNLVVFVLGVDLLGLPGPGFVPNPNPMGIPRPWIASVLRAVVLVSATLFLWLPLLIALFLLHLPATRCDTAGLRSICLGPTFINRLQQALTPEIDWLWLAVQLGTRLDPRIRSAEGRAIREASKVAVDDFLEWSESTAIVPAWPFAIWGRILRPDHGHFVLVKSAKPTGLIVFLHGHGGNSLLLPYLMRDFAERMNCAIAFPSFGYGQWEHPSGVDCVARTASYVLEFCPSIDERNLLLIGLSQGGAGVGRAASASGPWAGLVFLSPTLEPKVLRSGDFSESWRGREVLVLHGGVDRHVTPKSVARGIQAMGEAGVTVTERVWPKASHALVLLQFDEWLSEVQGYASRLGFTKTS